MITSRQNEQVKQVALLQKKAKLRRELDCFVAEGKRMVFETPADLLKKIYVTEDFAKDAENVDFLKEHDEKVETVTKEVMEAMSDTKTPQGILAVIKKPHCDLKQLLENTDEAMILCLENIQDPGNLGTMLRTAEGAGATGLLLSETTVDLFSPKVVRSTMGALYRMNVVVSKDFLSDLDTLSKNGVKLYGAHLKGAVEYTKRDYKTACGFLIGNEGNGLTDEAVEHCDGTIIIPMGGQLESLNAAMSAGILMYEASRQRRE